MTRRERIVWLVLLATLLLGGLGVGRQLVLVREVPAGEPEPATDVRTWLWERRTLDLLAQAGLLLAGALGVAAILPASSEGPGVETRPWPGEAEQK